LPKRIGVLLLIGLLSASCLLHPVVTPRGPSQNSMVARVSVEPQEYFGPCPVHIRTSGSIRGAPGHSVKYRFIGNGFPWGIWRWGAIPPSGTLRVSEVASIDVAHAGYFFRQVWIMVNGGRLDEFSNRALYTVTCGVPPRPRRVTWRVDTPMYQGPCPKTVNFAGSISAEPGTHVRYRIIANGAPWGPVYSADIGSSGTLAVSETLAIDSAHAGYFSRQLWVMRNGVEPDVYSKQAVYSVMCLPGRPGPHANYTLFDISAPTELVNSGDPRVCGDHVVPRRAAALCGAPLANGQLVLVWNWKPAGCLSGPCRSRIDGYRIYQILGKAHRLIATQFDSALTIATFAQKASAVAGNCYTVRAFFGNDESSDSNEVCVKAGYGETLCISCYGPRR